MNFILTSVLGSTALLSAAAVATLVLRGASAATRHALWLIAMVCSLLVPVDSMVLPELELPWLQSSEIRPAPGAPPIDAAAVLLKPGTVTAPFNSASTAAATNFVHPTPASAGVTRQSWSWRQYAAAFWVLGFMFSIGELLRGIWRVRSLLRSSQAVTDPAWLDLLPGLRSRLSVSAPVSIAIGRESLSPMTSGLVKNVVLFPPCAVDWSTERRRLVLAHELAHVRRRDGILQIVIEVICAVYWFNPLAWYAARRLRLERERACDDEVLSLGADADDYAFHLLDIAREIVPGRKDAALAISMTERSQLECRLRAIVTPRGNRRRPSRPATVVLLCSSAVLTVLIATVRLTALPFPSALQAAMDLPAAVPGLSAQARMPVTAPAIAVQEHFPSTFVKIPPGEFIMGCGQGESCSPDGAPPHAVQITRAFEIGKYELTQAEWQSVMATNPSDFKGADLPVEQVSWNDVQEFLQRLDAKRDGYHYRLPSEAEWEYAARAGATVRWLSGPAIPPFNRLQTPLDPIAWYGRNSDGHTHPVGEKQPNAWGLYDMFGNVEELVQDWYSDDYFASSPSRDPSGPPSGTGRVVRGGPSWDLPFSPGFRHDIGPESRYDFVGFRIVREPVARQGVFEVASIKPHRPGDPVPNDKGGGAAIGCHGTDNPASLVPLGRCVFLNAGLKVLIASAFQVRGARIAGGPNWLDDVGYDLEAKAEEPVTRDTLLLMLQSLLEDRFHLTFHVETRQIDGYVRIPGQVIHRFRSNPSTDSVSSHPVIPIEVIQRFRREAIQFSRSSGTVDGMSESLF